MKRSRYAGFRTLLAAGLVLFLSACGGDPDPNQPASVDEVREKTIGPELERRESIIEPSARVIPETFEYVRYDVRTNADAPIACLSFNSALNTRVDYAPYVEAPEGLLIEVEADGSDLCIGGLSFGEAVNLTLKEGLPSNRRELFWAPINASRSISATGLLMSDFPAMA